MKSIILLLLLLVFALGAAHAYKHKTETEIVRMTPAQRVDEWVMNTFTTGLTQPTTTDTYCSENT